MDKALHEGICASRGIKTSGTTYYEKGNTSGDLISAPDQNQINNIISQQANTCYHELKNLLTALGGKQDGNGTNNQIATLLLKKMVDMVVPVGDLYMQLPSTKPPSAKFPGTTWVKVDTHGEFFRMQGGGDAMPFSSEALYENVQRQASALPNIKGSTKDPNGGKYDGIVSFYSSDNDIEIGCIRQVKVDTFDVWMHGDPLMTRNLYFNAHDSNPIYKDGVNEVRPTNVTCRLWRRTA